MGPRIDPKLLEGHPQKGFWTASLFLSFSFLITMT